MQPSEKMETTAPYFPTSDWMAEWLRQQWLGRTAAQAADAASRLTAVRSRDFSRMSPTPEMTLSIPVAGGSAAMKRLPPHRLAVSEHGRWRHNHLGAFEAIYGKTPMYPHLIDRIAAVIGRENPSDTSLASLTAPLLDIITDPLDISATLAELHRADRRKLQTLALRGAETARDAVIDGHISFLTPLMKLGREAILPLVASFISLPEEQRLPRPSDID